MHEHIIIENKGGMRHTPTFRSEGFPLKICGHVKIRAGWKRLKLLEAITLPIADVILCKQSADIRRG